jgi:hypothetical protein
LAIINAVLNSAANALYFILQKKSESAADGCGIGKTFYIMRNFLKLIVLQIKFGYLFQIKNLIMKMVKTCLALVIMLTAFSQVRAQTADDIINKYFDAIGGKDKIAQIKSIHMENTVEAMGGEGPSTITILNGKGYRLDSEVNGSKITQVFTDKGGWMINPFMGGTTPQAIPEDVYKQSKERLDVGGPLFNYAAKGTKVALDGTEAGAYKLKVTTADSVDMELFIDSASYNLVKVVSSATMMGQTMDVTTTFSDFKKSDFGVVFPNTTEISYGGQFDITSKVKKLEINQPVDPAIFEMPKS